VADQCLERDFRDGDGLAVTIWLRWTEPFSGTNPVVFAKTALTTTVITTLVWLVVTYLTKAEPEAVLVKFYRSVRPQITGWQPVARFAPEVPPTRDLAEICSPGCSAA